MKKLKIINILILLLLLTGSCKKYVEGYDKDPNGLLDTNDEQLMQGVILENQFFNHSDGLRIGMMWMNQATGTDRQYVSFNNWNSVANQQFDSPWGEVYTVIGQARLLEQKTTDLNNIKLRGLAKLFRAWAGGMAASLWGDVPFSEAGLPDQFPDPKYDAQADVFNQVQTLLDEAIADLNNPVGIIYAKKDIYYGNLVNGSNDSQQIAAWVRLAHALKARFYLNAKDYQHAYDEATNSGFTASDDIIAPYEVYPGNYSKYNPMFQFDVFNREGYIGEVDAYASDLLQARDNNDETGRLYFNYIPDAAILNTYPGYWWLGFDGKFSGPQSLMTYGELQLIRAEARARLDGNISAALTIYNDYRNMLQSYTPQIGTSGWGQSYPPYAPSDFQSGGSQYNGVDELTSFLREVLEERYVYFIGDLEAFVDHARTHGENGVEGYMQLKPGFNGQPLRFIYPQAEIDSNDNFPGEAPKVTVPLPMYQ